MALEPGSAIVTVSVSGRITPLVVVGANKPGH